MWLSAVARSKGDGRWESAYDGAKASTVPNDLAEALDQVASARAFCDTRDEANRYAILYRVQTAKRPETRAERIERFVTIYARHETIHPTPKSCETLEVQEVAGPSRRKASRVCRSGSANEPTDRLRSNGPIRDEKLLTEHSTSSVRAWP